jgi:hypothetical protein
MVKDGAIPLPESYRDTFTALVSVTLRQDTPLERKKDAAPRLSLDTIDAMLQGSVTESLIGALSGCKETTLDEIRRERLKKYETAAL